ncbi:putative indolepyruvate ferredoxin oxidoreductase, beta subunit [Pillotina sp. SPG140]
MLSIAALITRAASYESLVVRQSEVHGMAQRGGAVLAHLRIADGAIASDLVPRGTADLIISLEPLESLRYIDWLSQNGAVITAMEPLYNIPDYPECALVFHAIQQLPRYRLIPAAVYAKEIGLPKAVNTVMLGAAAAFLPLKTESLEDAIKELFALKATEANIQAFRRGKVSD